MERLTYTAKEAAQATGCSYIQVLRLAKRPDFPAIWLGRKVLIPKKALEAWLMQQAQTPAAGEAASKTKEGDDAA